MHLLPPASSPGFNRPPVLVLSATMVDGAATDAPNVTEEPATEKGQEKRLSSVLKSEVHVSTVAEIEDDKVGAHTAFNVFSRRARHSIS